MKIIFLFILFLLSKIGIKTLVTFSLLCSYNYSDAQSASYSSRNNAGFNSWSVYKVNSPGNTYTNSIQPIVVNMDSVVIKTKLVMLDSLSKNNDFLYPDGKFLWLRGRQLMATSLDSLEIEVTPVVAQYGLSQTGSTIKVDSTVIVYTTKFNALKSALSGKLNISDTTGKWAPAGVYDRSVTNEIQSLSVNGLTLSLSDANSIVIPTLAVTASQVTTALGATPLFSEVDGSVTNEIQTLSISQRTVTLSNGGGTVLIPLQDITYADIVSGLGYIPLASEVDGSITNEIQTPSITGNTLSLSGTTVTAILPTITRTSTTTVRSLVTSTAATGFSISATRDYNVNYSIYAEVTATTSGVNTANVFLEISNDNSTWTTVSRVGISVDGVNSVNGNTQNISGFVPAGFWVRIRTAATGSNSGSAVFTYQNGQENSY